MLHAGGSIYPWMSDPNWTDTWIADSAYLDTTGAVGIWKPQKGTIQIVQATVGNKPAYSAAWGSGSKGQLTYNGTTSYMTGNALAAKVTANQSWTIICAFQLTSVASFEEIFAFSNVTLTHSFHVFQPDNSSPSPFLRAASSDDLSNIRDGNTAVAASTSKVIATISFDGTASGYSIRFNGTNAGTGTTGTGTFGTITLTQFTVGAFFDVAASLFCAMKLRALLFMPRYFVAASCRPAENYLIAEAA